MIEGVVGLNIQNYSIKLIEVFSVYILVFQDVYLVINLFQGLWDVIIGIYEVVNFFFVFFDIEVYYFSGGI